MKKDMFQVFRIEWSNQKGKAVSEKSPCFYTWEEVKSYVIANKPKNRRFITHTEVLTKEEILKINEKLKIILDF